MRLLSSLLPASALPSAALALVALLAAGPRPTAAPLRAADPPPPAVDPLPPRAVDPLPPRAVDPLPPRAAGPLPPRAADPIIAAAGDIACDPADPHFRQGRGTAWHCRMRDTSDLLLGRRLAAVLLLGDNQYEEGTLAQYRASFHPTWGRVKPLIRPTPGNHEYDSGGRGYFAYFGAAAGDPARGYYSFDLGAWHLVALNSNCGAVGGCGPGSPQDLWLRTDLAASAARGGRCILAYWHHPRFSSARHGGDPATGTFWKRLHAAGAAVVLNGHDHVYERFAPQDPAGRRDPARGIRQFTVGTGGKNYTWFRTVAPNSEARDAGTFGVLELALHPRGYSWRFRPAGVRGFTDSGAGACPAAAAESAGPVPRRGRR